MKKNYPFSKIILFFLLLHLIPFGISAQSVSLDISGNFTINSYSGNLWLYDYKATNSSAYIRSAVIQPNSSESLTLNPFVSWDFKVGNWNYFSEPIWGLIKTVNSEYASISKSPGYSFSFTSPAVAEGWRGYILPNNTGSILDTNIEKYMGRDNALYMSWNYGNELMIVSPKLNNISTDKKCTLYAYGEQGNFGIIIGTITNPYDPTTFHPLKSVITGAGGTNKIDVFFNNYTANDQYIAIKPTGAYGDVYLDDFSYEQTVNCFDITNVVLSNITENSAQLDFNSAGQSNFEVNLKNLITGVSTVFNITNSSYILNTLSGNTDYEVKIRANCGDGLYSNWSSLSKFKTICNTISSGYTTSFDETSYVNPCWGIIKKNAQIFLDNPNFQVYKPQPRTGGEMIIMSQFMEAKTADQKALLITPYINDLDATKRIKFYLVSLGLSEYNSNTLTIGTMSDPKDDQTFIPLKTISASEMNEIDGFQKRSTWKEHIVYLDNYDSSNNHHYIALKQDNLQESIFYLDDFSYENKPLCTEPLNPKVVDFGFDFATVTWENYKESSATEWQIEYGPKGFSHGAGTLLSVTSNPYTISNSILDDTEYDFYVRSKCGTDYSDWSDKGYFKTKCAGVNAGYTTDFENDTFEVNTCWSRIIPKINKKFWSADVFIQTNKPGSNNIGGHSGKNSISIMNELNADYVPRQSISDEIILVSPRLKDFDNYKKIRFWMYSVSSAYSSPKEIVIGTLSDNDDSTTFTPYRIITSVVNNQGNWIQYEVDFSDYYGTDKYIGIKQNTVNQRQLIFVDDFEYLESGCPKPTALSAAQIGTDTVSLFWQDNNGKKPSDGWEIEYGIKGFTEGTGTIITADTNPFNLSGLPINSKYEYRVRAKCNASSVSIWSNKYAFKVSCTQSAPFTENFDQYDPDLWAYPDGTPDLCWTSSDYYLSRLYKYSLNNINSSPNSFFLEQYNDTGYLSSPYLPDFDQTKKVKFWVNGGLANQTKAANLIVGTIKNPLDLTTFEPYESIPVLDLPLYGKEFNVDFSNYNGSNKHIAFKLETDLKDVMYLTNRVYIDDINYGVIPTCYEPIDINFQKINDNSVIVKWTTNSSSNQNIEIEYGISGFALGSGTTVATSQNAITIPNLATSTSYDFYLKSVCGSEKSIVVGPKKIDIVCSLKPLPWIEKFNNLTQYGKNVVPNCFKFLIGNLELKNAPQSIYTNAFNNDHILNGFDDSTYMYVSNSYSTKIMTPMFNLQAGTTYKLNLKARKSYEYSSMGIDVSVGRGQEEHYMESDLSSLGTLSEYQYNNNYFYFTPIESGDYSYLLNFRYSGTVYMTVDDIELKEGYENSINTYVNYNLDTGVDSSLVLEKTHLSTVNLINLLGNNVLRLSTSTSSTPFNTSGNVWKLNQNLVSKVNFKVNPLNMSSLYLKFDLKQTYSTTPEESLFRVVVNGTVLGNVIKATTASQDGFITYQFDLSPYLGSEIRISLQHLGKTWEGSGDNAYLDNIGISATLSSNTEIELPELKVYPNPAHTIVTIENNETIDKIQLFNLNGQQLHTEYNDTKSMRIDLTKYSVGTYFLKVYSNEKMKTIELIKK
jgi:hypothetical protein